MADEATTTGQEPATGQEPNKESTTTTTTGGQEPKVFDEDYVKKLRDEAAGWRTKAQEAQTKVVEHEDAKKSDQQKLEEKATGAETRATAAEKKALRYEVAAKKGVPLEQAHRLQGDTKEELEADADEFVKSLGDKKQRTSFDGGARERANTDDMDSLIRRAAGRA